MIMKSPQKLFSQSIFCKACIKCIFMMFLTSSLHAQEAPKTSSLREVDGLKLNCPVPFVEKATGGPNEMIKAQMQYTAKTDGVEALIVSIEYKGGIQLDVDKIAKDSAASFSKLDGVTNPVFKVSVPALQGADAASVLSFRADRFGKILRTESTYVRKGQHLWMVALNFEGGDKRATFVGETISKSIRLR